MPARSDILRRNHLLLNLALAAVLGALVLNASSLRSPTPSSPTNSVGKPDLGRLPIAFHPNTGQTDPSVRFMARTPAGNLYFTPSEVVLSLSPEYRVQSPESRVESQWAMKSRLGTLDPAPRTSQIVRLQFVGSNASASIRAGTPLPGRVNYLLGNDPSRWRAGLPTCSSIAYGELYLGIDLTYEGSGQALKGTYTIAPNADPGAIRWRYAGAKRIEADAAGNLQITLSTPHPALLAPVDASTPRLTELAPLAWQVIGERRVAVSVRYEVGSDGAVGFRVGSYDRAHPLIIDPTLTYSSYLGGSAGDQGYAIALDSEGNMYVTGLTNSANFPTANAYQPAYAGSTDAFVTKLNPAGSALIYSTFLGGNALDQGFAIAVDSTGSAYITGNTVSTNFPTRNAYQPMYGGGIVDTFATKLNASGSDLVYSTYLGGSGFDTGQGVAVDGSGNAYFAGLTNSVNYPTLNPYQANNAGAMDVHLTKLSATGAGVYSTYLGGNLDDFGRAAAVDTAGNAYVTGQSYSANFPTVNPFQGTNQGTGDAFVTKFNPSGSTLLYSTFLGGSIEEVGYGVAVDPDGHAYVTGTTSSLNFPTRNPFQPNFVNFIDAFVTKFTPSGSDLVYSTYLGGNSTDYGFAIAVDAYNQAHVTGYANSTNFPIRNPIQATNAGGADVFVTVFLESGQNLVYSTYLGGGANDFGRGIALDGAGTSYVAGLTDSSNFPTVTPYQPNNAGGSDVVVFKIFEPVSTPTPTSVPPTSTSTPTATQAPPTASPTTGPTRTATATVTPCVMNFRDVQPTDYFFEAVRYLYCEGVISGYGDGTFRPYNNTTRGQLTKIVVLAFGIPIYTPPTPTPTFSDVPPTDPFYQYVETAAYNEIVSGYSDGTFRPYNNVTRGQLCKIVVIAAGWPLSNPPTPHFTDVPLEHPFYTYVETAHSHGIISGYSDGTFRPGNNATRGQISKIVHQAITPPHTSSP